MPKIEYRRLDELVKLKNNPRHISEGALASLRKSISQNPKHFDARPLILSNRTGKLVIIAGNMRYEAAKSLQMDEVPTILLEGLTEEEEREIAIRDNINNGDWDWDLLANEWDDLPLEEWGLVTPTFVDSYELGTDFELPEGDRAPFQQMSFIFADEQAATIKEAIKHVQGLEAFKYAVNFGNENSNGNALYFIIEQWFQQNK